MNNNNNLDEVYRVHVCIVKFTYYMPCSFFRFSALLVLPYRLQLHFLILLNTPLCWPSNYYGLLKNHDACRYVCMHACRRQGPGRVARSFCLAHQPRTRRATTIFDVAAGTYVCVTSLPAPPKHNKSHPAAVVVVVVVGCTRGYKYYIRT